MMERLPVPRFENARKLAHKSRQTDPADRYLEWLRLIDPHGLHELLMDSSLALQGADRVRADLYAYLAMPNTRHFADRIAYAGLRLPLPENGNIRVDKMSMAMSVEARSPLEDYRLVELALSLPLEYKLRRGDFKTVFKDAIADLVPGEVLQRPKWGFTPPASQWLRTALRPLVESILHPERVAAAGIFRPEAISRLVHAHIVEGKYELWPLWSALVLHLWYSLYIDRSLSLDHPLTPADLYMAGTPVGG
jgi:asparagine synthase (glutamine-hydrolysing)